ncbi:MAG TPA: 2-amino-4-hydroxy-6-hydroxymethyldihydropteridine diphosphokinase [Acidimicrobiia bacterium]|jgi:2-amino-4-hydroxy-6-hydroxymethyldihydropteridine diphosphokinase|nr:2-amino-4-hydroxy-6-hydroxymethyldihydropteridine diphosphokinase [Acidimicrobiia bacterium]
MERATRYAIGLGSNQGDRLEHLTSAVAAIGDLVDEYRVSSLYETEPVGGPEQDPFLNAVMVVDTSLGPLELLDRLQTIETDHGRQRKVRWGPRTLDLDLVGSDGATHDDDRLTIPHPRAAQRGFVLVPLVELWPTAPVGPGTTAAEALGSTDTSGIDRLARNWQPRISPIPAWILMVGQLFIFLVAAVGLASDGRLPEGQVTALGWLGVLMAMAGLVIAFVALRRLGPVISPSPAARRDALVVVSGPYRYVRHPIYGGVFLVLLGTALFVHSVLGVVASLAVLVFFWVKSVYEERQLRIRSPGYWRYQKVVRRRMIPFVF